VTDFEVENANPELGHDDGLLHREFSAELTPGDGRTVDVRIVPYGETITHADGHGGVPVGVPYQEQWMPGVFSGQVKAANRVLVNVEHQKGLAGVVGHGIVLREGADGFYGSFKLHETPDGDKALMLVREGVLQSVSLEAIAAKSVKSANGVIQRVKARLVNIALTRFGAYPSAQVLALREETILDESLFPVTLPEETINRCRALGIRLPQRYLEAHPAETDTPASTGTSEDGTRPAENDLSTSSEET